MLVHGIGEIEIAKLRLPPDFRQRLKSPNVINLGESMDAVGQLHEPLVRATDHLLISGGDRVASHVVRGHEKVLVKFVECTDEEAELASLDENLKRRMDPERNARELERRLALRSAMEARALQAAKKNGAPPPAQTATGRAQKPEVAARDKEAKARGVKPESVRKQQQRARKRTQKRQVVEVAREAQAENKPAPEVPEPPINDIGFELSVEFLQQAADVKALVERAAGFATSAMGQLTQIATKQLPFPQAKLQRLREDAQDLAAALRGMVPASLCPYCKGQPEYQPNCTACVGHGYITKSQMDRVPEAAWAVDVVMVGGKTHKLVFGEQTEPMVEPGVAAEPELGALEADGW